ncbi:YbaK/EbsC family protein [Candidatus Woesearchaeota archaeon]|nr:YbaK/EbsC family protein [Nanoarchaeota archaeon]MCB9370594.1 YbaK/EbsC family protein [Candidatus Woesearchaeota archaeon]USN43675.1 MAG: YbaK/EbsC family protein [Candidatus Woesearchaeota archaeon]
MQTKVTKFLDEKNIAYKVKLHKEEALTCELAAKERNCRISQIIKTMVAKDDKGNFHICLIPGDKILKLKKVRQAAGGIKIDLADPNLIAKELDLIVGAISPFLFPEGSYFYADESILREKEVDVSSGDPKAGIEILSEDLLKLTQAKLCDIISTSDI